LQWTGAINASIFKLRIFINNSGEDIDVGDSGGMSYYFSTPNAATAIPPYLIDYLRKYSFHDISLSAYEVQYLPTSSGKEIAIIGRSTYRTTVILKD